MKTKSATTKAGFGSIFELIMKQEMLPSNRIGFALLLCISLFASINAAAASENDAEQKEFGARRWRLVYDSLFYSGLKRPFEGAITDLSALDLLEELTQLLHMDSLADVIDKRERTAAEYWTNILRASKHNPCTVEFDEEMLQRRYKLATDLRRRKFYNNASPPPGGIKLDEYLEPKRRSMVQKCREIYTPQLRQRINELPTRAFYGFSTMTSLYEKNSIKCPKCTDKELAQMAAKSIEGTCKMGRNLRYELSAACRGRRSEQYEYAYKEIITKPCYEILHVSNLYESLEAYASYVEKYLMDSMDGQIVRWIQTRHLCRNKLNDSVRKQSFKEFKKLMQ